MSRVSRLAAAILVAVLGGCSASQGTGSRGADGEGVVRAGVAPVDLSTVPGFGEMKARCFNGVANQPQQASRVLSSGVDVVAESWVSGAGYSPGSRIYDAAVAGCAYGIVDSMTVWGYARRGELEGAPPTTTTTAPRPCPTGQPTITVEETAFDPYDPGYGSSDNVVARLTVTVINGTSAPVTPSAVLFSVITESEKVVVETNPLDVPVVGDVDGRREIEVGGSHSYDQVDFDESVPAGSTASLSGWGSSYYVAADEPRIVVNEIGWNWSETEFHDCPTGSIEL